MKFNVPDMTCGHCVATVTKAVKALDPVAEVKADLAGKIMFIADNEEPVMAGQPLAEIG